MPYRLCGDISDDGQLHRICHSYLQVSMQWHGNVQSLLTESTGNKLFPWKQSRPHIDQSHMHELLISHACASHLCIRIESTHMCTQSMPWCQREVKLYMPQNQRPRIRNLVTLVFIHHHAYAHNDTKAKWHKSTTCIDLGTGMFQSTLCILYCAFVNRPQWGTASLRFGKLDRPMDRPG
jgi:hypothetical protein